MMNDSGKREGVLCCACNGDGFTTNGLRTDDEDYREEDCEVCNATGWAVREEIIEAVEFAEWIKKWWAIKKGRYVHKGDFYNQDKKKYTTLDLYQIFKQQP